jgi:ribonuclease R
MALQDSSKIYDGVVSGVTEWGIFVEIIENRCEGMVRITDLNIDTFDHLEKEYCLVGRRTNLRITFGDKVKVRVKAANLEKRNIDFVLEELAGGKVQPKEDRSIYQKPVWTKGRKSSSKGGGRKRR